MPFCIFCERFPGRDKARPSQSVFQHVNFCGKYCCESNLIFIMTESSIMLIAADVSDDWVNGYQYNSLGGR